MMKTAINKLLKRQKKQPKETSAATPLRRSFLNISLLHFFEFIALLLVVLLVAFGLIAWQLSKGPLELSFLQEDAKAALVRVFGGQSASIGKLEADWSAREKSLVIVATDVHVTDVNGVSMLDIPRFEAGLDGLALLQGKLEFSRLVAIGGEVSLVRREDGVIGVGIGSIEQVLNNPRLWQQQQGVQAPLIRQALLRLQFLAIRGGALNLKDLRSGIQWRAPDAQLSFLRRANRIEFLANGLIESNGLESSVSFEGVSNTDFSNLTAKASLSNYIPAQLVPDIGRLSFLSRVQVPVSSSLSIATDEVGLLVQADFELQAKEGVLLLPLGELAIESGQLKANFNASSGTISINTAQVKGPKLDIGLTGNVRGLDPAKLVVGEQIDFDLDFAKSYLDLTGLMQGDVKLDDFVVQGAYLPAKKSLDLKYWKLAVNRLNLSGTGQAQWLTLPDGRTFPKLSINGRSGGRTSVEQVLAFWPTQLAEGVRTWAKNNMRSGNLYDFILQLKLDERLLDLGGLSNDMLTLSFSFDQLETTYFGTMPPIKNASGTALLRGNRFDVNLTSGSLMSNQLSDGYVEIPYLYPAGAMAVYGAKATGPLSDLLHILDQKPFGYVSLYRITPANVSGDGFVDFQMHRPMRTKVPFKDMSFSAKGKYSNVGAPALIFEQDLSQMTMSFKADESGLEIDGQGLISDWPSKFNWSEDFKAGKEPRTKMNVQTRIDASLFDGFGLPTRDFFDGEIGLILGIIGNGLAVQKGVIYADLKDAFLDLPGPGWNKPKAVPGSLSLQVYETDPGEYSLKNLALTASGLDIKGQMQFSSKLGLRSLQLTTARMDGAFDFTADIERNDAGVFLVDADIFSADISSITGGLLNRQLGGADIAAKADIRINRTIAGSRLLLNSGRLKFGYNGQTVDYLDLVANSDQGEHSFSILPDQQDKLQISATSKDGGAVLEAFLGFDGLLGGELSLTGELARNQETQTVVELNLQNFQLANTPVVAQVLSLGSLRGLSDTLSGSGIAFETLVLPIQSQNGFLHIRQARATGPAMGLTLEGDVNLVDKELTLQGVIAPAYTLNSLFRAVPIVGNILVPRQGEGIFGLTYSVDGPFSQMQVSVNPLSAFTPGVLRQMFGGQLPEVNTETEAQPSAIEQPLANPPPLAEPETQIIDRTAVDEEKGVEDAAPMEIPSEPPIAPAVTPEP